MRKVETKETICSDRGRLLEDYAEILDDKAFDPIVEREKREIIAQLLENQRVGPIVEGTLTGDIQKYEPVMIPIIRRAMPKLIPMDIFGTQPMNGPVGLAFCLRGVYHGTTDTPVKRANSIVLILLDASAFTVTGDISTDGAGSGIGVVNYIEAINFWLRLFPEPLLLTMMLIMQLHL